jgi:hypothetical protein
VGTWTAQLELAVLALVYVPVGATVTHIADPLYDRAFSLQELEVMSTIRWKSHDEGSEVKLESSV